tara:strand:+ start:39360 stop:39560 length:201 start_codon:yes stop_codon:yes gene_type:complete
MNSEMKDVLIKVPQVTLGFWIIKILAATLVETGGLEFSRYTAAGALLFAIVVLVIVLPPRAASKLH